MKALEFRNGPFAEFVWRTVVSYGRPVAVWDLLQGWDRLVGTCESGYGDIYDELMFDLDVRRLLEEAITSYSDKTSPDYVVFRQSLSDIDYRYRSILLPDNPMQSHSSYVLPWWEASLPDRGRQEFVESVQGLGLPIRLVK